jgi:hypothetical protein
MVISGIRAAETKRVTMPESALPRSKPSSNVQALHNTLLDIYPHRWQISVSFNEINEFRDIKRVCGGVTHVELSEQL